MTGFLSLTGTMLVFCVAGVEPSQRHYAVYARHKEIYLNTAHAYQIQGVLFIPVVAECTDSWDPEVHKGLKYLVHPAAARWIVILLKY